MIQWLSGYLEGEGSFIYTNTLQVSVQSTDKDIVEKVAKLFGKKNIGSYDPNKYEKKKIVRGNSVKTRRKRIYYIAVHGIRAYKILQKIYKYMGQRRKKQINRIIKQFLKQKIIFKTRVSDMNRV
jgi:hypothetical protein